MGRQFKERRASKGFNRHTKKKMFEKERVGMAILADTVQLLRYREKKKTTTAV